MRTEREEKARVRSCAEDVSTSALAIMRWVTGIDALEKGSLS